MTQVEWYKPDESDTSNWTKDRMKGIANSICTFPSVPYIIREQFIVGFHKGRCRRNRWLPWDHTLKGTKFQMAFTIKNLAWGATSSYQIQLSSNIARHSRRGFLVTEYYQNLPVRSMTFVSNWQLWSGTAVDSEYRLTITHLEIPNISKYSWASLPPRQRNFSLAQKYSVIRIY